MTRGRGYHGVTPCDPNRRPPSATSTAWTPFDGSLNCALPAGRLPNGRLSAGEGRNADSPRYVDVSCPCDPILRQPRGECNRGSSPPGPPSLPSTASRGPSKRSTSAGDLDVENLGCQLRLRVATEKVTLAQLAADPPVPDTMGMGTEQPKTPKLKPRWYRLTPGRFLLALLAVEGLLWLAAARARVAEKSLRPGWRCRRHLVNYRWRRVRTPRVRTLLAQSTLGRASFIV